METVIQHMQSTNSQPGSTAHSRGWTLRGFSRIVNFAKAQATGMAASNAVVRATRNELGRFMSRTTLLLALTLTSSMNGWGQCSNSGISGSACTGAGGTTIATITTTGSVNIDSWQTQSTTTVNATLTWIFSGVSAGTAIEIASSTGGDAEFTITGPSGFSTLQVDADNETDVDVNPDGLDETATFVCTVAGEYRVRVSQHSACSIWSTAGTRYLYWRVRGRTPADFTLSGPEAPCVNVAVNYTAGAGSGSESWTFPANFSGTGNSATVTRTPTSTASGTISCTRTLGCSSPKSATNTISVSPVNGVPAQPSTITGTTSICSSANESFSVTNVSGVTYTWSYSGTGTISGSGNSITLSATTGGTLTCTPSNSCGNGTVRTLVISWNSSASTYYSKSTGNLNDLSTWGTNSDGTGCSPANFSSNGVTYIIQNNLTPTTSGAWNVSGTGSIVKVGNASSAVTFTPGGDLSFDCDLEITGNATLNLNTRNMTLSGDFIRSASTAGFSQTANADLAGSTVTFSGSSQNINVNSNNGTTPTDSDITFNHVTISGSDVKLYYLKTNDRKLNINNFTVNNGAVVTLYSNPQP